MSGIWYLSDLPKITHNYEIQFKNKYCVRKRVLC